MPTSAQVLSTLGYPGYPSWETHVYLPLDQMSAEAQARIDTLISELATIDTQIETALNDSMATQVGELKVDFNRQIALLKNEGTLKLQEISNLSGLELMFNKYTGARKNKSTRSKFSPA